MNVGFQAEPSWSAQCCPLAAQLRTAGKTVGRAPPGPPQGPGSMAEQARPSRAETVSPRFWCLTLQENFSSKVEEFSKIRFMFSF